MYKKSYDNRRELTKEEKLERMLERFLKDSKDSIRSCEKEHTKSDSKKKKKLNNERRKQNAKKRIL